MSTAIQCAADRRERPILMSGPMVRPTLVGAKTQTRRVAKLPADVVIDNWGHPFRCVKVTGGWHRDGIACPYGDPGDRLWVRESWSPAFQRPGSSDPEFLYRADLADGHEYLGVDRWRPSIHMPRRASRITLELTGVRVERVQDISEADALAEGMIDYDRVRDSAVDQFHDIWDSLNAARGYGWNANPWVWVLEFAKAAA